MRRLTEVRVTKGQRLHALLSADEADARLLLREEPDGDDAGPLIHLRFERRGVGDVQALHVDDGAAVVGDEPLAQHRGASEGAHLAAD